MARKGGVVDNIQVRFSVRDGEVKGTITHDPQGRGKIVFVAGYRLETAKTWRGPLPKDGEEWSCEVVRDTKPGDRRGALIVRLHEQARERWTLEPIGQELLGVRRCRPRHYVGARLVSEGNPPAEMQRKADEADKAFSAVLPLAEAELRKFAAALPATDSTVSARVELPGIKGTLIAHIRSETGQFRTLWSFYQENDYTLSWSEALSTGLTRNFGRNEVADWVQALRDLGDPAYKCQHGVIACWPTRAGMLEAYLPDAALCAVFPCEVVKIERGEYGVRATMLLNVMGNHVERAMDVGRCEWRHGFEVVPANLTPAGLAMPVAQQQEVASLLREKIHPMSEHAAERDAEVLTDRKCVGVQGVATLRALGDTILTIAAAPVVTSEMVTRLEQFTEPESDDGYRREFTYHEHRTYTYLVLEDGARICLGSRNIPRIPDEGLRRWYLERELARFESYVCKLRAELLASARYSAPCDPAIYAGSRADEDTEAARSLEAETLAKAEELETFISRVRTAVSECKERTSSAKAERRLSEKLPALKERFSASVSRLKRYGLRLYTNEYYVADRAIREIEQMTSNPWGAVKLLDEAVRLVGEFAAVVEKTVALEHTRRERLEAARARAEEIKPRLEAVRTLKGWYDLDPSGIREAVSYHLHSSAFHRMAAEQLEEWADKAEVLIAEVQALLAPKSVRETVPVNVYPPTNAKPASTEQVATSLDALKAKFGGSKKRR